MSDYRDPKVIKTGDAKSKGAGKWIGIALAVLVALLLLGWLLGWFGGNETEVGLVGEENPAFGDEPATAE